MFVGLLVGGAVLLVVERLILLGGSTAILLIVWLTVYVIGAIVGTLVWALAGVLDARQAKRLFPLCASAAILCGFVGMISAGPLAKVAGTETLILTQAALLSAGAALTWDVSRAGRTGSTRRPTDRSPPSCDSGSTTSGPRR